jgi:uncharacterized protein YkwD
MTQRVIRSVSTVYSFIRFVITKTTPFLLTVMAFCHVGSSQSLVPANSAHLAAERSVERSHAAAAATSASPSVDDASAIERRAFERTNEERVKSGLSPLVWDAELCRMARIHSENMARMGFFGHETPEGLRLKERARSMGIVHFRVIAENIAYNKGYQDPGAFAVERWMISAGHRANILYVGFQASAIGSYVSADGSVYLTQVFINR